VGDGEADHRHAGTTRSRTPWSAQFCEDRRRAWPQTPGSASSSGFLKTGRLRPELFRTARANRLLASSRPGASLLDRRIGRTPSRCAAPVFTSFSAGNFHLVSKVSFRVVLVIGSPPRHRLAATGRPRNTRLALRRLQLRDWLGWVLTSPPPRKGRDRSDAIGHPAAVRNAIGPPMQYPASRPSDSSQPSLLSSHR
jgi:hypothetical protein